MKFLFICSANKKRSKTAEGYYSSKYENHEFSSIEANIKIWTIEGTSELT